MSNFAKSEMEVPPTFMSLPVRSIYVHVPFCEHRCGYCDFSIIANRAELIPRYLKALQKELKTSPFLHSHLLEVDTLYIGGGTPTLLSACELEEFFSILSDYFSLVPDAEYTIEANPDGLTADKIQVLKSAGVNRVSLGVQAFDDSRLIQLERTHSVHQTEIAIELIQQNFKNYSLDLIFAIPGQTLEEWQQMLLKAISFHPPHISSYALTYEKGTRFWSDRNKGKFQSTDDQLEVEMYLKTISELTNAGYDHYEISNFAKAGSQSRHNNIYWSGRPYLAFGPGAASFVNGQRHSNHRSSFTWMNRLEQNQSPIVSTDDLTAEERARELLAIGLRRRQGINLDDLKNATGIDIAACCETEINDLIEKGWIQRQFSHLRITSAGLLFADEIASILV
ncbi:radical SAM family heme chaperone HemW [Rubinisphaera italica]|uniref:Heme chaperone HemW n=1 Tax=Rubinisphaera italica TaxID=2527969 RepID=A0A5C5XCM8_9PLAN|nr:radical SAM family heme chaperone HemW [Rubinisphaera italica]TWT60369.1 Oxygen-independent coproporphyrinogen-III oxidase-like protein [Rubinisphaera italica]